MHEIPKVYQPSAVEQQAQAIWQNGQYYRASAPCPAGKKPFCIVIPPPNVTAALHLGHALNNTLQDILIRWRRMQGYNTLWMPGTDHAGIATQTVVEKRLLAEQGKRRTDFSRSEFVAHVQAWKDEYEARILGQLRQMGCSCDWTRTRFTMDDVCARAVRAVFFKLFADGLIYRGKRLVNWDPATQTVLADDEVEYQTVEGFFYYLKYPLVEPVVCAGQTMTHITVATTRPETMLGDTAVAVNPIDRRAAALVGKSVRLPIVGRIIPIIADEAVVLPDPGSEDEKARYSTGFLKVTPAHDPNDWEIGRRHNLAVINVMAPDGTISDKYGWMDAGADAQFLLGMDRFEAREAIVEWFRQQKLLEGVREYTHEVGHSYRSHVPIEPYLSDQWYIAVKKPIRHLESHRFKVKCELTEKDGVYYLAGSDVPVNSLAGLALAPLLEGRLKFYPPRYAKTYQVWLENLRDWPISRQLWWGHQIPIWSKSGQHSLPDRAGVCCQVYETPQGQMTYVCLDGGLEALEEQLQSEGWQRDPDVLDTWFSSALWPFSTMGWPEPTAELKTFYPTNVLCTAREIITLWVSRMVMMGQYCIGDIPFYDVYIHAMIQDGLGRKMSKSLGNGIDPLVIIDSHGADAMRFTLASMTTDTQDVRMPVVPLQLPDGRTVNSSPKFDIGRAFCNKLWNASRFAMMNLDGLDPDAFEYQRLDLTDRWILGGLAKTIRAVNEGLGGYKFNEPINELYRFFWNDFCDWYLEWCKPRMQQAQQKPIAQNVLAFVLDQLLRLLHPFVPFITEGIFQNLNAIAPRRGLKGIAFLDSAESLMISRWPQVLAGIEDGQAVSHIERAQAITRAIRDIRSQYNIPLSRRLDVSVSADGALTARQMELIGQLTNTSVRAVALTQKPSDAAAVVVEGISVYVHQAVDTQAERQRLVGQKEFLENGIRSLKAKLENENFLQRAKPEIVQQTRGKLAELTAQLTQIEKLLTELS